MALGVVGCATSPESRIADNSEMYDGFPDEVQEMVADGEISIGFNRDMVFLAMGTADEVTAEHAEDGSVEVWTYFLNSTTHKKRINRVGSSRKTKSRRTVRNARRHHMPRYAREEKVRESLRVVFEEGRVASVNRLQE